MIAQVILRATLAYGPLVSGVLVALVGLVVLVGWQFSLESITRIRPWLPSMLPLPAFGFLVSGGGLVALHRGHRRTSGVAGAIALTIAVTGLLSALPPRPTVPSTTAGLERLPAAQPVSRAPAIDLDRPAEKAEPPADAHATRRRTVPPNTAAAFALAGLAILLSRRSVYASALLGFGVITLGAVAALGHAADVTQAFGWGGNSYMALHSAVAFTVLGAGLVLYSLEMEARVRERRSWWRAGLVGASAAVAGLLFWGSLRAQERDTLDRMVDASARGISSEMYTTMQSIVLSLTRLVEHGLETEWHSPEEWSLDARLTVGAFRGFESIEWIGANFDPRIVAAPRSPPRELAPTNQNRFRRERALEIAHDTARPTVVGPFDFADGGSAFRVIVPLRSSQHPDAYVAGVFSAEEALAGISQQVSYDYDMVFLCEGREVFRQGLLDLGHPGPWAQRFTLELPGAIDWEVVIAPTRDLLSALSTPLPEVALGAALVIALLLTLTVRFGDMAIRRAHSLSTAVQERTRELETSMGNLRDEVTERRRTEAVLRRTQTLGRLVSAELDLSKVVQAVTDAATELTGAEAGCLVYTAEDANGRRRTRHKVSGQREIFSGLDLPQPGRRVTPLFPTPHPIRLHDIRRDPRHGATLPIHTPPDVLEEIASYLAVPVVSRGGHEWGSLQFAHRAHGVFTERDEDIAVSLAAQAAIAMDNAALYEAQQRANAEALATNEAKDNFIHMLGHELRNPLGSIRNAIQVLSIGRRGESPNGKSRNVREDDVRMQRIIDRQVDQLTRLVDDLLQVSQLNSNKLTLRPTSIDLRELIGESVESVRSRFEGIGLTLTAELGDESARVFADPHRIRQVLANLLENAGKFSDAGDTITVRLRRESRTGEAIVAVRDTGCGIEPKDLARVFQPFVQTELARDRMTGGLGLGLPIVRGLVEAQGGAVEVFSEGRDLGSEFRFRLPLQRGHVATPSVHVGANGSVARRILVVDDHRDSADALKRLLELFGNEVTVAYDGPEGIEVARSFHPEVLICDIGLPGMDGFEVARHLGEDPDTKSIYMIALTGFGDEDTIRAAREAGFRHHLTKPVETPKLEKILAEFG